jgi:hypothetical protein
MLPFDRSSSLFPMDKDPLVTIARDTVDATVEVPASELSGYHYASFSGGRGTRFAGRQWAAYVMCTSLPYGRYFGHSCEHGPPPHRIKVILPRKLNDPETFAALQAKCR